MNSEAAVVQSSHKGDLFSLALPKAAFGLHDALVSGRKTDDRQYNVPLNAAESHSPSDNKLLKKRED